MIPLLATMAKSTRQQLYQVLLAQVATHLLPVRPHRSTQGSETQTQAFSTNAATTSCLES